MYSVKIKTSCLLAVLLVSGCANNQQLTHTILSRIMTCSDKIQGRTKIVANKPDKLLDYSDDIRNAAHYYGVDAMLIKAIIQVESGFNPNVVSTSNAVGLMQLKPSTAGRDVYRFKGLKGQPSLHELQNPTVNIDLGAAYLNIIQSQQLAGIRNPRTLRYATIVAYVNGTGAMLRTFAVDKGIAVSRINQMSPNEFYQYIQKKHPAPQATRYLAKVSDVYQMLME